MQGCGAFTCSNNEIQKSMTCRPPANFKSGERVTKTHVIKSLSVIFHLSHPSATQNSVVLAAEN